MPATWSGPGPPKPPASSAALMPRGSSSSASGIAACLRDDPVAARARRAGRGPTVASRARASSSAEPLSRSSGRPATRARRSGSRTPNTIAIGSASSRRATNAEHLPRGGVEPLEIVHETQQRLLLGDLGQETERRQADQEAVGSAGPTRGRARPAGRPAAAPAARRVPVEQRRAQLVQAGERQLHLRLHAGDLGDPETEALAGGVAHQRRLARRRRRPRMTSTALRPRARPRGRRSSRSRSLERPRSVGAG
jgi:hypothetical protein